MRLSREQLHQLVWSRPLVEVAAELSVTNGELDVLLRTLDVPFPYSGYWASREGRKPRARKLPRAKPGSAEVVEIEAATSSKSHLPANAKTLEIKAAELADPGANVLLLDNDPIETLENPRRPRLTKPHRIIAARLEDDKRLRQGFGGWRPPKPNPREEQMMARRRLVESELFKALETAGHRVETERGSLHQVRLMIKGQTITHAIRERYTQKRRPLTAEELRDPWNVQMGRQHAVQRFLTGQLILTAEARGAFSKLEWRDKPERPIELQIDEIVQGLETLAEQAIEREAQRREEEKRRWEEQHQREAERRARQQDENQWRRFRELAMRHAESASVRSFIDALKREPAGQGDEGDALDQWIKWAEAKLADWDPLQRDPQALMIEVKAVTAEDGRS